jgi:hypothetical protein
MILVKKTGRPKSTSGVGIMIRQLLLKPLSYLEIAQRVQKKYPKSMIDITNVRWYAWKMRKEKVKLPPRTNSSFTK